MTFTASNGAQVVLTNAGQTGYVLAEGDEHIATAYLDFEQMKAWREFAQHERDEELGRWRWPESPDYVVYADEDGDVVVVNERKGSTSSIVIRRDMACLNPMNRSNQAAFAYFEAHPERKPWQGANRGDVWEFTLSEGLRTAWSSDGAGRFLPLKAEESHISYMGENATIITDARKIWPES